MNFLKKGEKRSGRFSAYSLTFLLVFLIIATVPGFIHGDQAINNETQIVKIRKLVKKFYDEQWFSGTVLVAEGDTTIFEDSCGESCRQLGTMNKLDTKFMVGSNTKPFTAVLIMKLVEQDIIKLDGTISDYLPYYTSPVGKQVRIKHLLEMSSGIPEYGGDLGTDDYYEIRLHPWTIQEFVTKFCMPDILSFIPGKKFEYTNTNYFILGAIIEAMTNWDYPGFLQAQILEKADMKNTGAYQYMGLIPGMAYGYLIVDYPVLDSERPTIVTSPFQLPHAAFSAGYLYSTVTDYHKWDQILYTDKLLPGKFRAEMFKPRILARSFIEELGLECIYFTYGWIIQYIDPDTRKPADICPDNPGDIPGNMIRSYIFGGRYFGYLTYFIRIPSIPGINDYPGRKKVSIMVFSNLDNFDTPAPNVTNLAGAIRDILFHVEPEF